MWKRIFGTPGNRRTRRKQQANGATTECQTVIHPISDPVSSIVRCEVPWRPADYPPLPPCMALPEDTAKQPEHMEQRQEGRA